MAEQCFAQLRQALEADHLAAVQIGDRSLDAGAERRALRHVGRRLGGDACLAARARGAEQIDPCCDRLVTISQGAISNMLARMGKPFGAAAEQIAATVRGSELIASDETSARVKGKTHWQWTFSCTTAVWTVADEF
jgi:hypothetical protein